MLSKTVLDDLLAMRKTVRGLEEQITKRTTEVLKVILSTLGVDKHWIENEAITWWYGTEEDHIALYRSYDHGNPCLDEDTVWVCVSEPWVKEQPMIGFKWERGEEQQLPTEFLFMEDSEIRTVVEDALVKGASSKELKKEKERQLKAAALRKLSDEEKAALGLED